MINHGLWTVCTGQFAQITGTDSQPAPGIAFRNELVFHPLMRSSVYFFLHFLLLKSTFSDYSAYLFFLNSSLYFDRTCPHLLMPDSTSGHLWMHPSPPHPYFFSQFPNFSLPRGLIQIIFWCHPPAQSQSSMSLTQALGDVGHPQPFYLAGETRSGDENLATPHLAGLTGLRCHSV